MRINSIPPKEIYSQYMVARDIQPVAATRTMGADHVEISDAAKSFSATLKVAKEAFSTSDVSRPDASARSSSRSKAELTMYPQTRSPIRS